ncbi:MULTISPECIES: hypothetical protein [unclassified Streptomyces]|uniref:hypothetical protein n=1 Tax=unclassified Streptomyces TaxID=2593676 RepID=UPI00382BB1DA
MAANQRPRPVRQLPVGRAVVLACDSLATLLVSFGLCAVGLLLPGLTEDYGPSTGPTSPTALAFFAAALLLLSSLAVTATLHSCGRTDRLRRIARWAAAARLTLLVCAATAFVVHGIVTIELA